MGIWVAILPYLGFPNSWRKFLFVLTGLALIYLAFLFYKQVKERMPKDTGSMQPFVDNISGGAINE